MRGHGDLFVGKEDGKRLSLVESQTPRQLLSLRLSPNVETNRPKVYVPVIELNLNV